MYTYIQNRVKAMQNARNRCRIKPGVRRLRHGHCQIMMRASQQSTMSGKLHSSWVCRGVRFAAERVCCRQRVICGSFYSPTPSHKSRRHRSMKCRGSDGGGAARPACTPGASGVPPSASEATKSIQKTEGGEEEHTTGQITTKADGNLI